jgi:hypothetical protein
MSPTLHSLRVNFPGLAFTTDDDTFDIPIDPQ